MKVYICLALVSCVYLLAKAELDDVPEYKYCLMECFRCIKTYGKHVYNGKLCAENCALTGGASIDTKCYPPVKRATNKTQLAMQCVQHCQNGCPAESPFCEVMCILSKAKVIEC